jgi:hypothetical protein
MRSLWVIVGMFRLTLLNSHQVLSYCKESEDIGASSGYYFSTLGCQGRGIDRSACNHRPEGRPDLRWPFFVLIEDQSCALMTKRKEDEPGYT